MAVRLPPTGTKRGGEVRWLPVKTINRSAVVIRLREPFLRWAEEAYPGEAEDAIGLRSAFSVYLVPPDPHEELEATPIDRWFEQVFAYELEGWCTDRSRWPATRDLTTFLDWFEVGTQSLVADLATGPIRTERL